MTNQIITPDGEIIETTPGTDMSLAVGLTRAEIDSQIATARAYPRSIKRATDTILSLATLDEETAEECMYALPRGGKPIQGPSIRLAEIIQQSWGNNRVAARVVAVDRIEKFVEAEGVYHDLETNSATMARVRRRISGKSGQILTDDMIIVTGNAACSIAKRNAILGGVPKPVWRRAYEAALKVIAGTTETLTVTRDRSLKAFANFGVKPEQIFAALGVGGLDDIGLDLIPTLRGMFSTLKNGEATVEEMFAPKNVASGAPKAQGEALAAKVHARSDKKPEAGFNEAEVRRQIGDDPSPGGDLLEQAHKQALQGRRVFDPWYGALSHEQQSVLASHIASLMKAANLAQHGASKQAEEIIERDAEVKADEAPPAPQEQAAPAFDFDGDLDAFEKAIGAIATRQELLDFGTKIQGAEQGWYVAAPDHLREVAQDLFQDRLAEIEKAEAKARKEAEANAAAARKAQDEIGRQATETAAQDNGAEAVESEEDRLLTAGRAAAMNGSRRLKLWFGKLKAPEFELMKPHKEKLEAAARQADEAL